MFNRPATTRLHLRSIKDMSAAYDPELADLFSEMREATGLPLEEIAAQLHTAPAVIAALERGDMAALPDWEHVRQVVQNYAGMLSLDPGPVLRRIMVQLPDDHAQRPRTATASVSHDDLQANAEAAMNRLSPSRQVQAIEVERTSLPSGIIPSTAKAAEEAAGMAGEGEGAAARVGFGEKTANLSERLHEAREDLSSFHAARNDDFRAIPPDESMAARGARPVSKLMKPAPPARRRGSFFVTLIQLALFIAIILGGYGAWLYTNDMAGFENYIAFFRNGAASALDWLMNMTGLAKG
jgi:transcriptional regulator with XRE-family HTH domain